MLIPSAYLDHSTATATQLGCFLPENRPFDCLTSNGKETALVACGPGEWLCVSAGPGQGSNDASWFLWQRYCGMASQALCAYLQTGVRCWMFLWFVRTRFYWPSQSWRHALRQDWKLWLSGPVTLQCSFKSICHGILGPSVLSDSKFQPRAGKRIVSTTNYEFCRLLRTLRLWPRQ